MAAKKSWVEKRNNNQGLPRVEPIPKKMRPKWGTGTIALPSPQEVDELMKQVPAGKLITVNELRRRIAEKHGATIGCPMVTGIFVWVAAHATEEEAAAGEIETTPYWRTLKTGGELNAKYPGGIETQKQRLAAEGHQIVARGKRWFVAAYQDQMMEMGGRSQRVG
jgi:alkylated DNA nucleotide flippase Atl1